MTEATKKLFKKYEQAFSALDVEKQVPMLTRTRRRRWMKELGLM